MTHLRADEGLYLRRPRMKNGFFSPAAAIKGIF
jgi:hypothetical protein